jgi:hypothetical protein
MDVEGSSRGIFSGIIPGFVWRTGKENKNLTHKELYESKIEPWISRRRIKDLRFRTKLINWQTYVRRLRARLFFELHCSKLKLRRLTEKRLTHSIKLCWVKLCRSSNYLPTAVFRPTRNRLNRNTISS